MLRTKTKKTYTNQIVYILRTHFTTKNAGKLKKFEKHFFLNNSNMAFSGLQKSI